MKTIRLAGLSLFLILHTSFAFAQSTVGDLKAYLTQRRRDQSTRPRGV